LEQRKWNEEDQRKHELINEGPASINEENLELQDEDITVNILDCYAPVNNIPFDIIEKTALRSYHSPVLLRKARELNLDNDERGIGYQELRDIQRATQASLDDFYPPSPLNYSASTDSFEENLLLALKMSSEEANLLSKADGKRPMK
jgi:hypothetical protein